MSQYFNKETPFFDSVSGSPMPFGVVYFGQPNTDPKDQDNNAKAPYTDREFTTPADSVQTLDASGKLADRLYLSGAYAITVTDADGVDISVNPYYVGESSDQIVNDSDVPGATLTAALNELLSRVVALEAALVSYQDVWPIGALYFTATNENPGSRLGFGTWTPEATGRVLVGAGSGTDANGIVESFTAGASGGEYEHTNTTDEMPNHGHHMFSSSIQNTGNDIITGDFIPAREFSASGNNDQYIMKRAATQISASGLTQLVGGGDPHNNIQPWLAVYIWRRTS